MRRLRRRSVALLRRRPRRTARDVDVRGLPSAISEDQIKSAVARVRRVTGRPLTAVGAGMTAIVFCDDQGRAYKVARRVGASSALDDEADWLRTANQVPGLRERVARLYAFYPELGIIVRSCPQPIDSAFRRQGKLFDLWKQIGARMAPYGWSAPEFKEDSFVITRSGPVLVDAGFAHRYGRRLLAYVHDILSGKRQKPASERYSDLAFYLRREVTEKTLRAEHVRPTIERLTRLDPDAREWMV